jgi:ParB/RepB/Spo0J family partition protein
MTPMRLETIPLDAIRSTAQNPRSDLGERDEALRGLAASLGEPGQERLVEPPVVEMVGQGQYRLLAGERRVQAARLAGWDEIVCLVRPEMAPEKAHTLRLVENLHRQDLHPLDQAAALKIEWLFANAAKMGLAGKARTILAKEQTPQESLAQLSSLLNDHDFAPTHPAVTWDQVLDQLGVALKPARRKKLLQILSVDADVQVRARETELTEAALRSLGQLAPDQQSIVMDEIEEDPSLGRKVRRISHAVRGHDYPLEDAIAEAKGQLVIDGEMVAVDDGPRYAPDEGDEELNDRTMDVVLGLLDAANQATTASQALLDILDGRSVSDLSTPWDDYTREAVELIALAIEPLIIHQAHQEPRKDDRNG